MNPFAPAKEITTRRGGQATKIRSGSASVGIIQSAAGGSWHNPQRSSALRACAADSTMGDRQRLPAAPSRIASLVPPVGDMPTACPAVSSWEGRGRPWRRPLFLCLRRKAPFVLSLSKPVLSACLGRQSKGTVLRPRPCAGEKNSPWASPAFGPDKLRVNGGDLSYFSGIHMNGGMDGKALLS